MDRCGNHPHLVVPANNYNGCFNIGGRQQQQQQHSTQQYLSSPPQPPPRVKHVYVDSSMRDTTLFPTAAKYDVHFGEDIHNVISVDLVDNSIPFHIPQYVFGVRPDADSPPVQIRFTREQAAKWKTAQDMVTAINTQLRLAQVWSVTSVVRPEDGRLEFHGSGTGFELVFDDEARDEEEARATLMIVLGAGYPNRNLLTTFNNDTGVTTTLFPRVPDLSAIATHETSPARHTFLTTIFMHINDFERVNESNNNAAKGCFCVLKREPLNTHCHHVHASIRDGITARYPFVLDEHKFTPPLRKLTKLSVEFRDTRGHLYDFQGHDHDFTLRFTMQEPLVV